MLGAVCGLETILERTDTPGQGGVRLCAGAFLDSLPLTYFVDCCPRSEGAHTALRTIIGETREPYERAAAF